jgi:uncharacterized protein (TIGR02421 family)
VIGDNLIETVRERLQANKRVRRTLPGNGRVHIDRQLPFLVLYRTPSVDAGTDSLIKSHPAYLIAPANRALRPSLKRLVQAIVSTLAAEFGQFLLVEIWTAPVDDTITEVESVPPPAFRICTARKTSAMPIVDTLEGHLRQLHLQRQLAQVTVQRGVKPAPPGLSPLFTPAEAEALKCQIIGLEIKPVYRSASTHDVYPLVLRKMIRKLTRVLQQTFFDFARTQTTHRPRHYQALGRRAMVKAVWAADRELAAIDDMFDFLLQVTPVNTYVAWAEFQRRRYARAPVFRYRPHLADPGQLKRRLWRIAIEKLEDPTIAFLFSQKREELDIQLTMLANLDTPRFLYGGLQLYGPLAPDLVALARGILSTFSARAREDTDGGTVNAATFAEYARAELEYYQQQAPELVATAQIREDLFSGLMVSQGHLLIGTDTQIPAARVPALLQHEIGTHIVTYYNGLAQPFRQLHNGLAGYDELQEGLAVLAEYLVGGLNRPRLRLLAARVVAAECLVDGATFVDTFRLLNREYGFQRRIAFTITQRIYRGGGLIKDAVYLRGLARLLAYIRDGGSLEPLLVGKIAEDHIPIIRELQWRRILKPARLRPRYLDAPETAPRLARLRAGVSVFDLVE